MAAPSTASPIAQASDRLQRAIAHFRQLQRDQAQWSPGSPAAPGEITGAAEALTLALAQEIDQLSQQRHRLDQNALCAAVFGLVSRGKSSLINGLIGEDRLETGPLNGVTRSPQSILWRPPGAAGLQLRLIDTPGLDEIEGRVRAEMAQNVAQTADFILFVVAGDMTRKEYQAIRDLWQFQKPLLLVFNKIDLYPPLSRNQIVHNLQQYFQTDGLTAEPVEIARRDVLQVAAAPAPLSVQTQWPDGSTTLTQETPPAQMAELTDRLTLLLQEEGPALLALNALVQVREAEQRIAQKVLVARREAADELIRAYARNKAIAVGLNPVVVLDLIGGGLADLALIRALAKLYDLPMTSYRAGRLLQKILLSSGSLLLSELGSGLFFGIGKGIALGGDMASGVMGYAGAAIAQGAFAGYGSYVVGRAAQVYLEQGCTWGETGASTLIRSILQQVDKQSILYRLRLELQEALPLG